MARRKTIMLVRLTVVFGIITATILVSTATVAQSVFGTHSKEQETCNTDECRQKDNTSKTHIDSKSSLSQNEATPTEINVIITFVNAANNPNLKEKFKITASSMLKHSTVPLAIHIIGETASQTVARDIIADVKSPKTAYRIQELDIEELKEKLQDSIKPMQKHFSYKPGAYYNHELFFLSIMLHRLLPLKRVIMLDADLKFKADIKELYQRFSMFTDSNVMGIGRDLQPVYRHTLWQYRKENPGTRVGEPPPDGLTGFNSGVLLLDLERMRNSQLYNKLITAESVDELTKKYHFKGHLGDQDFFSTLSFEFEELFHVLPCQWNRQLCKWWKDKGYEAVFDSYYKCDGDIKIYHGNCNTPIPDD